MAELTDSELRRKLIEFGVEKVGPITATTRPIYVKKLNHLRAAAKKGNKSASGGSKAHPPRKLLGFSSDESEDESGSQGNVSAARGRSRQTRVTRSRVKRETPNPPAPASLALSRPSLRGRRSVPSQDEPSTVSASVQASIHSVDTSLGDISQASLPDLDDPDAFDSSDNDFDLQDEPSHGSHSYNSFGPELVTRSVNTSPAMNDSALFNRTFTKWSDVSDSYAEGDTEDKQSPHTLRYRARPHGPGMDNPKSHPTASQNSSRLRGHTSKTAQSNSLHQNHVTNHITRNDASAAKKDSVRYQDFKGEDGSHPSHYSQYISLVLLVIVGLFFAILALVYLNLTGTTTQVVPASRDKWLICQHQKIDSLSAESHDKQPCYKKEAVERARLLVVAGHEYLAHRAGEFECGSAQTRNVTLQEIMSFFTKKYGSDNFGMEVRKQYSLSVTLDLIIHNPHWQIRVYDARGEETRKADQVVFLEAEVAGLSLWCRIQRASSRVISGALLLLTVGLSVALVVIMLRYRWHRQEQHTKQVYSLVESIIDILKRHYDACQNDRSLEPYLAIPHVRDMLIPLKDRKRLQSLWDEACRSLSANESRVRVETQKIAGEEFEVWRWLQSSPNGSKVWQGQAFGEHKDLGMNSPPYSLTQCLKIRNMFDPEIECEEDWHVRIQDAILEKCVANHGILHIAVDKTSKEGCVYVKCVDAEASGRCYKSLHGWWFDGNLVTVKYLRLERYHERFPDAQTLSEPMIPSNNHKLSLSQPFYRSIMEMA